MTGTICVPSSVSPREAALVAATAARSPALCTRCLRMGSRCCGCRGYRGRQGRREDGSASTRSESVDDITPGGDVATRRTAKPWQAFAR